MSKSPNCPSCCAQPGEMHIGGCRESIWTNQPMVHQAYHLTAEGIDRAAAAIEAFASQGEAGSSTRIMKSGEEVKGAQASDIDAEASPVSSTPSKIPSREEQDACTHPSNAGDVCPSCSTQTVTSDPVLTQDACDYADKHPDGELEDAYIAGALRAPTAEREPCPKCAWMPAECICVAPADSDLIAKLKFCWSHFQQIINRLNQEDQKNLSLVACNNLCVEAQERIKPFMDVARQAQSSDLRLEEADKLINELAEVYRACIRHEWKARGEEFKAFPAMDESVCLLRVKAWNHERGLKK